MLRRKAKRQLEQQKSEETSSKVKRKHLASENSDDEAERTLERLVFGGESDAIRELEKDFTAGQDGLSSSDEVRKSVIKYRSVLVASIMYL